MSNFLRLIERVFSCDLKPYLHIETNGEICIKIEFNRQKNISLLQHGYRFFVYSSKMENTLYSPFFACTFCFANRKHVIILRRIGSLFCWLKRAHASVNMSACTLFNKAKKGPNLLSISTWSVLGRQNVQAKKVSSSLCECWWNRNNIFNRRNR